MRKPERLLVVDIGNTSVTAGLYYNGRVDHVHRVTETESRTIANSDILNELADRFRFVDGFLCSVVPSLNSAWSQTVERWTGKAATFLSHNTPMPIDIRFPKRRSIGADRLANACGAVARYGTPCIVVDLGTALTFDIIDSDGAYIGGVIGPGMPLMFDYMADRTALLPKIGPRKITRAIGKSTEEAMRIGAQLGCRGMIREILDQVKRDLGAPEPYVVATGGYAKWVIPELDPDIPIDTDLTMLGLGSVYDQQ